MGVFEIQSTVLLVGFVIAVLVKGFAFVAALGFPAEAYEAQAKLNKPTWSIALGLGLVAQLLSLNPLGLLNIVFLIAAFVFLADVRPALREVTRR